MTVFKHLTFEEQYTAQPSLERLWDGIKEMFQKEKTEDSPSSQSSKKQNIAYTEGSKNAIAFLRQCSQADVKFKTTTVKINSYVNPIVYNGNLIPNVVFAIEKEAQNALVILNQSKQKDQEYLDLLSKVTRIGRSLHTEKEVEQLYQKYKGELTNTPVTIFKDKKLFNLQGRDLIVAFGKDDDKQYLFPSNQIEKITKVDGDIEIPACTREDVLKLIKSVTIFVKVIEEGLSLKTWNFEPAGPLHRGKVWTDACDNGNTSARKLEELMMYFQLRKRYPFASVMTNRISVQLLFAVCNWVKLSLESESFSEINS